SALLARSRAADHELGDGLNVPQLEQIASDEILPVVFSDLVLEQGDASSGPLQAVVAADDADVVPHEATNLVPVLGDDDGFVGRDSSSHLPLWNVREGLGSQLRDLGLQLGRSLLGEDETFEQ